MSINAKNHERVIVEILLSMKGDWVDGSVLRDSTHTSSLPARISSLRAQGYVIESRPPAHDGDFFQYKYIERTEPRGRRQLPSKLPPCPAGRPYSEDELNDLQRLCDEAIAAYVKTIPVPAPPKVRDWIDLMLAGET